MSRAYKIVLKFYTIKRKILLFFVLSIFAIYILICLYGVIGFSKERGSVGHIDMYKKKVLEKA